MKYGDELIKELEGEIVRSREAISKRIDHVLACDFDWDDCFISQRCDERGISLAQDKISLIKRGGCAWFQEYATLDGVVVHTNWYENKFGGWSLRAVMPDKSVVWTSANTKKGLAKKGLKKVLCLRPAWYAFHSNGRGMMGVYTGSYVLFPSDINYATGEEASTEPLEIKEVE